MAFTINTTQQGGFSTQTTNAMQSFFMDQKPQISTIIFQNHRGILPMNVYKSMGLIKETQGELSQHFEFGWIHPNFQIQNSVTAGGAGQTLVIQVATSSLVNGFAYSRVTDTLWFKNGNYASVTNKVFVAGFWNLTLNPYDPSVTLSVTAGDFLWIVGNTQVEGSTGPDPRDTGRQLLQFPLQTIRETWSGTGIAITNELWFQTDQFGKDRDTYNSGYFDAEYRIIEQMGNIATFQTPNINPNNTDVNMYGMDYIAGAVGNTITYFGGVFGINEFKQQIRYSNKKGSGAKAMMLCGPEFGLAWTTGNSNVLAQNPNQFVKAGDSEYSSMFVAGYEAAATGAGLSTEINFKKISYSNYTAHYILVHQWGYETTGGAAGFNTSGNMYSFPLTKAEDAEGTWRDRFVMTYKKHRRWNRALMFWETGGMAMTPTDSTDAVQINILGEWGTEFFGSEHMQRAIGQ